MPAQIISMQILPQLKGGGIVQYQQYSSIHNSHKLSGFSITDKSTEK